VSGPVFVVLRPNGIAVHRERPTGSPRNVWPGTIRNLEQHGDLVRLTTDGPPTLFIDVTAEAVAELQLDVDAAVWLSVKATDVTVYPA
jgi:molybdate transport system ATP-binding protein